LDDVDRATMLGAALARLRPQGQERVPDTPRWRRR